MIFSSHRQEISTGKYCVVKKIEMVFLNLPTTAFLLFLSLLAAFTFLRVLWKLWTRKFSGWSTPSTLPWLGTVLAFPRKPHQAFQQAKRWMREWDHIICLWLGPLPFIVTSKAEYAEAILRSKTLITKSGLYSFVCEWLGTGLLTSTGLKWKQRRRIITPSFHFNILNGFASIFDEQAKILVKKLLNAADTGEAIDVQVPVSLAKLDVICETSMGVKVNAQGAPTSPYVSAINALNSHIHLRMGKPWFWPRLLYSLTKDGREFYKNLNTVHAFTKDVIDKSMLRRKLSNNEMKQGDKSGKGKKSKVFLDMLLDLFDSGEIDMEGVREEVDTFMFEGHDTTAAALSWTLYELGRRPDLQERLYQELADADQSLPILERVKSMSFLDHVLKEGLRLHPPVPIFGRIMDADTPVGSKIIPRGTNVAIFAYMLHRNPAYWHHPDTFDPDRFAKEDFLKRHPYVFIPFSAGARNCIGQKFALLEEKVMLYHIVLELKFKSVQKEEDISDCFEVIHKSENGLHLTFHHRSRRRHLNKNSL